jgi:hypothetical protein
MSIRLRVRYQVRSVARFFDSFSVPAFLTGLGARFCLVAVVVMLSVGYIVQISHLSTGGYEIAKLEKEISKLSDESERLTTEVAEYQSISNVQKRLQGLSMVPAQNIKYVKLGDTAVAQR